jgi:hypothetical protein
MTAPTVAAPAVGCRQTNLPHTGKMDRCHLHPKSSLKLVNGMQALHKGEGVVHFALINCPAMPSDHSEAVDGAEEEIPVLASDCF